MRIADNPLTAREFLHYMNQVMDVEWVLYNPYSDALIIGVGASYAEFTDRGFYVIGVL